MKKMYCLIVCLLIVSPLWAEMTPNDITYYTEDYPPYNFVQEGKKTGFATDILLKIFEKLNLQKTVKDIMVVPWARGYNYVQKKNNVCLFTMSKTEERVKKYGFRWVGPVTSSKSVLIAKTNQQIKISSMQDVKKYRVCAIRDDISEQIIVNMGYPMNKVGRTANAVSIMKKLLKDRCQLWSYGNIAAQWMIIKNGFKPGDFEVVYPLTEVQYTYYAFNKNTPDSVVVPLQKAFDELNTEGVVDQLISKYLK